MEYLTIIDSFVDNLGDGSLANTNLIFGEHIGDRRFQHRSNVSLENTKIGPYRDRDPLQPCAGLKLTKLHS
jgi:hypothetical protein